MANYRKSFNLRNGVQIDDDNFIVNANGLVGIGTSVPTEFLDVRGNAKVVGLVTTNSLYAGIATVGFLTATQGLSVSGVITATSFSGSASGLTGIYAIAVDGWNVNSATSSISTSFNVGIGTTAPIYSLQVGQDPIVGNGVAIQSSGNIRVSGAITATSFSGNLDATGITTGTINNQRLPSNISVGIITASSGFYGDLTGVASTASSITTTANITVNSINSGFSTSGISTVHTTLHVLGNIGVGTLNPNAQIHLRKSGISSIQLTSNGSNSSIITLGRNVNISVGSSNAQLRFGNTSGSYPSSTEQSFDIINYDIGNLNFYLNPGGSATAAFNWFKPNLGKSMTLTSSGNLGIGSDSPTSTLSVVGNANISGVTTSGSFIGNGVIPIGGIIMWSGTIANIPTGWALCDGNNQTPDLRNRFIVGAHSGAGIGTSPTTGPGFNAITGALNSDYTPGNIGGSVGVALTIGEMPSHYHSYSSPGTNPVNGTPDTETVASASFSTEDTGSTGDGQYHENRPPYYALAFIMRIS